MRAAILEPTATIEPAPVKGLGEGVVAPVVVAPVLGEPVPVGATVVVLAALGGVTEGTEAMEGTAVIALGAMTVGTLVTLVIIATELAAEVGTDVAIVTGAPLAWQGMSSMVTG